MSKIKIPKSGALKNVVFYLIDNIYFNSKNSIQIDKIDKNV